jgi:hypothetical protein
VRKIFSRSVKGVVSPPCAGRLLDLSRRTSNRAFARPSRSPADLSPEASVLFPALGAEADRDLDLRKHVVLGSS